MNHPVFLSAPEIYMHILLVNSVICSLFTHFREDNTKFEDVTYIDILISILK